MSDDMYIRVVEDENEEEIEIPLEDDKTLNLATLQGQFPGACGLKYRGETGSWRGLRVTDGSIAPVGNDWSVNRVFVVVYPKDNKRKGEGGEGEMETDGPKTKRLNAKAKIQTTTDLIVMNLPWKVEEQQLKEYFEQFGEMLMVQLKKDLEGKSRGFAFIRFKNLEDQNRALNERHRIEGRLCDVKIPQSKAAGFDEVIVPGAPQPHLSRRIFVGRVTESVTREDLEEYFTKYGEITDVFVPRPHRMFAFVTFADAESARSLLEQNEDHLIKGCSVNVAYASPMKPNEKKQNDMSMMGNPSAWAGGPPPLMNPMMAGNAYRPKMPENPMEMMGMAMAMMKTWMQDGEEDPKKRGRQDASKSQQGPGASGNASGPYGGAAPGSGNSGWNKGAMDGRYYGNYHGGYGGYGGGGVW